MSETEKTKPSRTLLYWHSEGLIDQGNTIAVRSANLIDFFLVVADYVQTAIVAGPKVAVVNGVYFPKPSNLHTMPSTLDLTSQLQLLLTFPRFLFDILFGKGAENIRTADISVSVGLSGYGTLVGMVRSLIAGKVHAFVVRGDRLLTVRGTSRNVLSKNFAIVRISIYRKIMLSLVQAGRAEIWFQGRGHHAKLLEQLPEQCASRLLILDAVLRDLETPPKIGTDVDLIFVGRLTREKGLIELVEAIKRLSQKGRRVSLRVVGRGPDENLMETVASKADVLDQIDFVGFVSSTSDIVRLLASARLFVLPSYTEGLPRSLLEAMWVGTPCVSTPVGGIPFLFDDNDSIFFVEPQSIESLEHVLSMALDRVAAGETTQMVNKARQKALECTFDVRARYFAKVACREVT